MNEQDQIKAIAELDGKHFWIGDEQERDCSICGGKPPAKQHNVSDYLHSYNAIIPVIQKCSCEIRQTIAGTVLRDGRISFMSTPQQLCEALLRATGKWID